MDLEDTQARKWQPPREWLPWSNCLHNRRSGQDIGEGGIAFSQIPIEIVHSSPELHSASILPRCIHSPENKLPKHLWGDKGKHGEGTQK